MTTPIDWKARAATLRIDGRALIDGRRVDAVDGATFDGISPLDGRVLAPVARGRAADLVAAEAPKHQPGDPLDPATAMGALVDDGQLRTVLGYIDAGQQEGAQLRVRGRQVRSETGGYSVEPTVFEQVTNTMTIAREEIFGPVLSVIRFRAEAQAVAMANDSTCGLLASVWTSHIDRAHRVARALHAGTVHVNQYDEDDITVPFGGVKQSGNGRDKSLHALHKYTELKTTWLRIGGG